MLHTDAAAPTVSLKKIQIYSTNALKNDHNQEMVMTFSSRDRRSINICYVKCQKMQTLPEHVQLCNIQHKHERKERSQGQRLTMLFIDLVRII